MLDIIKILSEIQLERVAVCTVSATVPKQVLLKASPRKRDALALKARAIVINHVALEQWYQQ